LISCSPALLSLCRGNSLPREGGGPGRVGNPHLLSPRRGGRGAMTKGSEQAGRGGAAPGTGGRPKDTGTCSSARINARNCSIRTLPVAPPALSTPAGGTRRPLPPPGTSLRTTTPQLSFLFCSNQSRSESQCRPAHRPAGLDFRAALVEMLPWPVRRKSLHDRIRRLDDEVIASIGAPRRHRRRHPGGCQFRRWLAHHHVQHDLHRPQAEVGLGDIRVQLGGSSWTRFIFLPRQTVWSSKQREYRK
jgi:hypothetical protein